MAAETVENEDGVRTGSGPLTKEEHERWAAATSTGMSPANRPAARPNAPVGAPFATGISLTEAEAPFHPSPSLDPRMVEALKDYEDFKGYLEPARSALESAVHGLLAIDKAWDALRKDQSKTAAQKTMAIEPAASKKFDHIHATFSKASENLSKAVQMMEEELTKPIVTAAAGGTNAELRSVLRKMKPEERDEVISKAVKEGDETVVNAALGVHHLITGVNPLRHQLWTRQWWEQRNPDTVRRLNATKKAIELLAHTAPIALSSVEKAMRGKFRDAKKFSAMADASDQAVAAVNALR